MNAAALLIVLLSNDGYWFGARPAEVRFELPDLAPAGRVTWVLAYDDIRIASDSIDVVPGRAATVRLTLPIVRQRTHLRLVYRLSDVAGKQIEAGEAAVYLFPDDLLHDAATVVGRSKLMIWGEEVDPLAALLTRAAIPHRAVAGATTLRLLKPDVVLIAPGALDAAKPEFRPPIESLARGGATVIVFRQKRLLRMSSFALISRKAPPKLRWRGDHPLLAELSPEDLASLALPGSEQRALRVPADDSATALATWPADDSSQEANEAGWLDALLATRTIGEGRLIFCQLPLGNDWQNDPRAQMFLRASLEYSLTPPDHRDQAGNDASEVKAPSERSNLLPLQGKP